MHLSHITYYQVHVFFQATLANLRELKLALDNFETMEIANFSAALTKAFELLEIYRNNSGGANCNQVLNIANIRIQIINQ